MRKLGRLGGLGRLGKTGRLERLGRLPRASVIIPTYNRDEPLRKTLESLFVQDYPNFEIIVVDQSDKKFPEKEKFLKRYKKKIAYFKITPPNLPAARNFGVRKAKGEIIIFCDDDVIVKKGWILGHIENYSDLKVGAVAGRVITKGQKIEPNFKGVGKISRWGTVAGGYSSKIPQEIGNLIGCNMSFRKQVLESVGGFDEKFIGNALREETDVALTIKKLGWKIVFSPKAELVHLRAETGGCRKGENRLGWYKDFFHNEAYFCLKHISWIWWPVFWLTRWQWFLRCMFGFGREVSWRSITTPFAGIAAGVRDFREVREVREIGEIREIRGIREIVILIWLGFVFGCYFISWARHLIEK